MFRLKKCFIGSIGTYWSRVFQEIDQVIVFCTFISHYVSKEIGAIN